MTLLLTLTLTVLLQRNTRLFLFSLMLPSFLLRQWMRPNLPYFLVASNATRNRCGPVKWKKRLVKDVRLLPPLTKVMKIVRLTSPLPDKLRLSSLRTRLRHGRRLALPSHLNLCTLSFVLSLAFLPHLSLLLTSPTVPLPESRLWFSSIAWDPTLLSPSQRLCLAEPKATFLSSAEPRALRSLIRRFVLPFSLDEFLVAATNLPSSTATGPNKVAYSLLKHLPRSDMEFFLHIFNLSWSLHSFPSIWKTSSIVPIHRVGKTSRFSCFLPVYLFISCVWKLFERIILSRQLFFLEYNSILSPR